MPTDRVHRLPQQAQPRAFPPDTHKRQHQTQPHNLEIPARLRTRRATPVPSRYTRSEGVSCLRIGCTAPHNKHNCGQFLPTHPSGSIRRSHTTSKYPPGSEQEALHPFRRATPVPSRCTRSVAIHPIRRGVMPTDRVHCRPRQVQLRTVPPDTPKRQHQTQPHNLEIPARLRTRRATPDPSRYTRSVAIHPIRRGVTPTDRVHRPPRQTHLEPRNPNHCVPAPASGKGALSVTRSVL